MEFRIDSELRDLVPPLSNQELAELERSLIRFGCRDPLVLWKNGDGEPRLLDGHHRLKLCRRLGIPFKTVTIHFDTRDEARLFLIDNQAARRNLPKFTMVELQLKKAEILEHQAKENQRASDGRGKKGSRIEKRVHVDHAIATASGTGKEIVFRTRYLLEHAEQDLVEKLRRGEISVNEAFKTVRCDISRAERLESHKDGLKAFNRSKVHGDQNVLLGDFRKVSTRLADNSIDLILTDPPYDHDSICLYRDLAEMAARALKPGSSLVAYCGNRYIAEILAAMTAHLKFYWLVACVHTGGTQHEQHRRNIGVVNKWKPVLWFVKEKRGDRLTFMDDIVEGQMDKSFHPWGQGISEAKYFIEKLTMPNGVVFDPCAGGGTVLAAAKELKRRWIGCDIDKEAVRISRQRLAEIG